MADPLQSPTARLGYRFVCTTSVFAQKKDTRSVGGRGISALSDVFSFDGDFFSSPSTSAANERKNLSQCGRKQLVESVNLFAMAMCHHRVPKYHESKGVRNGIEGNCYVRRVWNYGNNRISGFDDVKHRSNHL